MAIEDKIFHIVIEIMAIIISIYFLFLSKKFDEWKKIALIVISSGIIIIDVYALLSWWDLVSFLPKTLFHMVTEALAIPGGIILIILSREKINDKFGSWSLLIMGILSLLVDGYLFFTWF